MTYHHHSSSRVLLDTSPEFAFAFLDDPHHLSSHMGKSSMMMAGSKMKIKLDSKSGKDVGAEIVLEGSMLGLPLLVREFVTESVPGHRKVWETKGPQKMLIIDQYKMGFELAANGSKSTLSVFIDYDLPVGPARALGALFGHIYAKWCVEKMASDAKKHFEKS